MAERHVRKVSQNRLDHTTGVVEPPSIQGVGCGRQALAVLGRACGRRSLAELLGNLWCEV
jgi:hypothetical protein